MDDFSILSREQPHSLEAEQTVLGGMLVEPDVIPQVVEILKADAFYQENHRKLFSIIVRLFSNGRAIDFVVLVNEAVAMGVFETEAMAKTYLAGIMEGVPSVSNIRSYCGIVDEKYQIRTLLNVANEIIQQAGDGSIDAQTLLDSAEQKIYDIRQGKATNGMTRIDEVIVPAFDHLSKISGQDKEQYLGTSTGFKLLDTITTGLNDTDLLVLAARPGMGKSAFALNIATNYCRDQLNKKMTRPRPVAIFSLEMGKEQLVTRMLSSESLVSNSVLRSGKIEPDDWIKLAGGADSLARMPIYLDETPGITVPQMKAKLRRLDNCGLVIIDYLQLMSSPNHHNNRVTEVSEITRQLKLMAKELKTPVMVLSQLNRGVEGRTDHRPMLSDLRESGSIEQDADLIYFLYRESYYNQEDADQSSTECIVAKNRHGETGTVKLAWLGEYTLFRNIDVIRE